MHQNITFELSRVIVRNQKKKKEKPKNYDNLGAWELGTTQLANDQEKCGVRDVGGESVQ